MGPFIKNDVILNKIRFVHANDAGSLKDKTRSNLNIQRACEASIDLAMHIVAEQKLGLITRR